MALGQSKLKGTGGRRTAVAECSTPEVPFLPHAEHSHPVLELEDKARV